MVCRVIYLFVYIEQKCRRESGMLTCWTKGRPKSATFRCRSMRIFREFYFLVNNIILAYVFWENNLHLERNVRKGVSHAQTLCVLIHCLVSNKTSPAVISGTKSRSFQKLVAETPYEIRLETLPMPDLISYFYQQFDLETKLEAAGLSRNFFKINTNSNQNLHVCGCWECLHSFQNLIQQKIKNLSTSSADIRKYLSWMDYIPNQPAKLVYLKSCLQELVSLDSPNECENRTGFVHFIIKMCFN